MTLIQVFRVAVFAVLAAGFVVQSAPAKDWRAGLFGFFLALFCATVAIYWAANP